MTANLRAIARALGGEVAGGQVLGFASDRKPGFLVGYNRDLNRAPRHGRKIFGRRPSPIPIKTGAKNERRPQGRG